MLLKVIYMEVFKLSRSYKRSSVSTDGSPHTTKEMKRYANSKVRKTNGVFNGNSYKKLFCSYDIHDYISRWSKQDAIQKWFEEEADILNGIISFKYSYHDKYKTLKNYLNRGWAKWYKRK